MSKDVPCEICGRSGRHVHVVGAGSMFTQKGAHEIAEDIERGAKAAGLPYPQRLGVVPNSVVLMFVRGWQGGTDTQIAAELGVAREDIHGATYERMGELMRLAQKKRREVTVLVPEDVFSHEGAWRTALEFVRDAETAKGTDDAVYWGHELAVFNRTWLTLRRVGP